MKRLLLYFLFFMLMLGVIWIYDRMVNKPPRKPVYREIDNKVKSISVINDSINIRFNSDYFDSLHISSEVTATSKKDERFIFSNVLPVKNKTIKIPVKQLFGYEGEKYDSQKLQVIKFDLQAFDSVFQKYKGHYSYSVSYYKTTYHHYELWYGDSSGNFRQSVAQGNKFYSRE